MLMLGLGYKPLDFSATVANVIEHQFCFKENENCHWKLLAFLHTMFINQVNLKLSDYFNVDHCRNLRNSLSIKHMSKFALVDIVINSFFIV